jgi:hypothetical protein
VLLKQEMVIPGFVMHDLGEQLILCMMLDFILPLGDDCSRDNN